MERNAGNFHTGGGKLRWSAKGSSIPPTPPPPTPRKLGVKGVRLLADHRNPGRWPSRVGMPKPQPFPLPFSQRELQSEVQTLLDASVPVERCTVGTQATPSAILNTSKSSAVGRVSSDHHPSQAGDGSNPRACVLRANRAHL